MTSDDRPSIVEYYSGSSGYSCGYCKSSDNSYRDGMWAHELTVQDYQDLINRGWRRSGCYCYKPTLPLTCCPMYTIKCSALDFKLSKSQKKKLKRFHNFLAFGKKKDGVMGDAAYEHSSDLDSGDDMAADTYAMNDVPDLKEKADRAQSNASGAVVNSVDHTFHSTSDSNSVEKTNGEDISEKVVSNSNPAMVPSELPEEVARSSTQDITRLPKKTTRPGEGPDPNRPLCKKAKLLRLERKEKKLAQSDSSVSMSSTQKAKAAPTAKTLEDFIYEPLPPSPAHRLEIRLVRSSPVSKEFNSSFPAVLDLYQRYQCSVHNDPIEKVNERQFRRFLVNSPLKPWKPKDGPPQGYGSFHQQYWLDDRLIAVGVIDILPLCVSSVYFFYDPEFHFLVLGTYGSLREISFTRSLHHSAPSLRYYYMGYYIHSCPKMRYKGAFSPSFLLCPETYAWFPIEKCLPRLDLSKYCRFNDDPDARDVESVTDIRYVSVLFSNKAMRYYKYLTLNPSSSHEQEVKEYADLVGDTLSKRILLLLM